MEKCYKIGLLLAVACCVTILIEKMLGMGNVERITAS